MKWEYLLLLIPLAVLGLLGMAIAGAGPVQHEPMDPDEEREWLRKQGLCDSEIDDIQRPMPRFSPSFCRCEPRTGYGTTNCPVHRSGE